MIDNPIVRDILDRASDLPPDQRAAYLDNACADKPELRTEVDSLLHALDLANEIDRARQTDPGFQPTNDDTPQLIGSTIGPYRLVDKIGEGGMGVVYLAEQATPVQRRVALKIIKPGMDSAAVIKRFEAERQALALMDHSNIARVYDAGTTTTGRPYFVMELVQGEAITRYCDKNRLSPQQRLELFVPVCQAIEHAHQKGIIHRDLKPSNVMVTLQDGRPMVKVIDFGIAKAINQPAAERSAFTQLGMFIGTPEYMSPEQAGATAGETDTRSDVYALGVILYELLTGATPIDREELRRVGYEQIMRTIREVDPPRPSTRLSTAGEGTASVSAQRSMEPRRLANLLAGDLDCIVMKCLEKDRARRYETVSGLASDISRYLRSEPIEARPNGRAYLIGKFINRNRLLAGTSAVVFVALVAGAAVAGIGLTRARRAQAATDAALQSESEQRRRAEARVIDTRQMATAMFEFDDALLNVSGTVAVRRLIATTALKYLNRLNQDTAANASLLRELAVSYDRVGDVLGNPNNPNLGDLPQALSSQQKALEIRQRLLAADPNDAGLKRDVTVAYTKIGELQLVAGQSTDALASYASALKISNQLLDAYPTDKRIYSDLATNYCQIGDVYMQIGDLNNALTNYQNALVPAGKLEKLAPDYPQTQRILALVYENIGDVELATGKVEEALAHDALALKSCQKRAADSNNSESQRDVAVACSRLGDAQLAANKPDDALVSQNQALKIDFDRASADPADLRAQRDLAIAYVRVGHVEATLKQNADALANYNKALDLDRKRAGQSPGNAQAQQDLSTDFQEVGNLQASTGMTTDALASFRRCVEIDSALAKSAPDDPEAQRNAAVSYSKLAAELVSIGQQKSLPTADRLANLQNAKIEFQLSLDVFAAMKTKNLPVDPGDVAEVTHDSQQCNRYISQLQQPATTQSAS